MVSIETEQRKTEIIQKDNKLTEEEYFKVWLSNRLFNPNTFKQYIYAYNRWISSGQPLTQQGVEIYLSQQGRNFKGERTNTNNHQVNRSFIKKYLAFKQIKNIEIPKKSSRGSKLDNIGKHKFITKKQVEWVMRILPPKEGLMVKIYFETGLRLIELINAKKRDFNIKNNTLVGIGKGFKPFEVVFSKVTSLRLKLYLEHFDLDGYPFKYNDVENSEKKFHYILKKRMRELDVAKNIHTHSFRHALGHHLRVDKQLDLEQIREILRHTKLETTQIYSKATKEEVRKIMKERVFEDNFS